MRLIRRVTMLALAVALLSGTAFALIELAIPLAQIFEDADFIFTAKVEKVDPEKPAMILIADADLKGKNPYRRLPINLTGDKEKHTPILLERVAADVPVVVFVTELPNKSLLVWLYTNGSWFQVFGTPDGSNVRWAFTHGEPVLRQTFKSPTAEMVKTVQEVISGKQPAPAIDKKEPAGFGPKVEKK